MSGGIPTKKAKKLILEREISKGVQATLPDIKCKNCGLPKDMHGQGVYCPQSYGSKKFTPSTGKNNEVRK